DPAGFSFDLGDSPTNDGGGGDANSTCYDAEVQLNFEVFSLRGADGVTGPNPIIPATALVAQAGCSSLRFVVDDQLVRVIPSGPEATTPFGLRIDPPACTDGQGTDPGT